MKQPVLPSPKNLQVGCVLFRLQVTWVTHKLHVILPVRLDG